VADSGQLLSGVTLVAALGCGLVAGVFFAFSSFVMKALGRLPPGQGIAAMQSINVAVLNPWFLGAFLGTAAVCALASILSLLRWQEPGSFYVLAGSALYLVGTLLVTAVFNIPRNDALGAIAATDPDAARLWAGYIAGWTAWNHVRTAAALGAAAALTFALPAIVVD
jgi:uncharacterized membrane protein